MASDNEAFTERNDPEGLRNYYIDRDGNRIPYDPKTVQPPVVYGDAPYSEADLGELEEIDPDGLIVHESHGEYEPYPGDAVNPSENHQLLEHDPVTVDRRSDDPSLTPDVINGYGIDLMSSDLFQDQLQPENGKFHIRYYGVVEHAEFAPRDPDCFDEKHTGLISLAVRGMGDDHLHTDLHTFNPLSLLVPGSCPPGSRVRVDIQDFDNVILDYIYNYPRQLFVEDYDGDPEEFIVQSFLEIGQWDGNKKMRLIDFLKVVAKHFGTSLGDLYATLEQYDKDHDWIVKVPTQLGMTLDEGDGVTLPYSHLPKPGVRGSFDYNPATHMGTLSLDYVDYVLIPPRDEPRIFQMRSPQLLRAGTIPEAVRPRQNMRLTAYAECTVRSNSSETVDEDRDAIDLVLRPDGSVWIDGTIWLQHHEVGRPTVKENDRWRVEVSTRSGVMFL